MIEMIYKDYNVIEITLTDTEYPDMILALDAPCGCSHCQETPQIGHSSCRPYPAWMESDPNVYARETPSHGWVWEYMGTIGGVDEEEINRGPVEPAVPMPESAWAHLPVTEDIAVAQRWPHDGTPTTAQKIERYMDQEKSISVTD